ncbi:MAG: hypothetical protein ACLFPR_03065 [Desulfococcaceae bacterium]
MTIPAIDLIIRALAAWCMKAHVIYKDAFGPDILPAGKSWASPAPKAAETARETAPA